MLMPLEIKVLSNNKLPQPSGRESLKTPKRPLKIEVFDVKIYCDCFNLKGEMSKFLSKKEVLNLKYIVPFSSNNCPTSMGGVHLFALWFPLSIIFFIKQAFNVAQVLLRFKDLLKIG